MKTKVFKPNDHFFNYPSFSPYTYVGNNPIILVDPDGKDWYRSHDTGREIWYEGSGTREGYDHIGPNAWIRGDRDYLYYEQNELVDIDPNPRYYMRADVNSSPITERDREYHSELATALSAAGAGASIYSSFHVLDGNFRGASGNYYYIEGRRGWNQYTGTKAHIENAIRRATYGNYAARGLGLISYGHNTYLYGTNQLSGFQYGIEMSSTTIQNFAPFPFNVAWTIGYEGLGRQGVARIPFYQNTIKPWARNQIGLETATTRP